MPARTLTVLASFYFLPNAIDNASFIAHRQNRDRDDVSYYIGHFFRLAWNTAASLLLISLAIGMAFA